MVYSSCVACFLFSLPGFVWPACSVCFAGKSIDMTIMTTLTAMTTMTTFIPFSSFRSRLVHSVLLIPSAHLFGVVCLLGLLASPVYRAQPTC